MAWDRLFGEGRRSLNLNYNGERSGKVAVTVLKTDGAERLALRVEPLSANSGRRNGRGRASPGTRVGATALESVTSAFRQQSDYTMSIIWLIFLNEIMVFLTIIIAFPGMLPPKDRFEWVVVGAMFLLMSSVWWLYLAGAPFVFLVLYLLGDWHPADYAKEWPWNKFARTTERQPRRP